MAKYQTKTPIPAILHKTGGGHEAVTLPLDVVLEEASRHSSTIEGKVGVYWQGQHYSVSLRDLMTKANVLGR